MNKFRNYFLNRRFSTRTLNETGVLLKKIRTHMLNQGYDGYILVNSDAHKNEYLSEKDKIIKFVSNFSGSNALALITLKEAILWTDSRYYIQAEKELDSREWKMIPIENSESDIKNYINQNIEPGKKIAVDIKSLSVNYFTQLERALQNYKIDYDDKNIFDNSQCEDSNSLQEKNFRKIFIHDSIYTGKTPLEKFKDVRRTFNQTILKSCENIKSNSYAIVLNKLDDIAWLTNLRGGDIPFNPVFFSYAILFFEDDIEYLQLYINEDKFEDRLIHTHLENNKIKISPYQKFYDDITQISEDYLMILDKNSCNQLIYKTILSGNRKHFLSDINIVEWSKAIKNERELQGFRECHKRDGAAIIRYLAWLEDQIINRKNQITEYEGARKLYKFRKENEFFIDESFDTISSVGENSAIIHYKPQINNCKIINQDEIYLLDSGGHYLDGTTDTTRTVHFGKPTQKEKEIYTRVLLGNLSIEKIFLNVNNRITGSQLDIIARQYLWRVGEDFGHGTGHGVGYFLNVHEGPHGISPRSNIPLKKNMVVTNEPGFYLKEQFGIRIENILLIQQHKNLTGHLCFENVTQVNYEPNLIDTSLLSKDIIDHINSYHYSIYNTLEKYLVELKDGLALDYLKRKTQYI